MKTNHILLTAALLLSVASCTKEATEIPGTSDDNTLYPVTFSGGIDLVQTKGDGTTTQLRSGIKAAVYVYKSTETVPNVSNPIKKDYTVGDAGVLAPSNSGNPLSLTTGKYKFYAVSIDSTASDLALPEFTSGVTSELSNGLDYIWAKAESQTISGGDKTHNVELKFERKAVKVVINIQGGDGITLDSWAGSADGSDAMITPPAPATPNSNSECKMTLTTGEIKPATTVSTTPVAMVKGDVAETNGVKTAYVSYIMLPLVESGSSPVPEVTLKLKVKNTGEASDAAERTYKTKLKYPTNGFVSGNQYTYTATLKANGITFTGATVTDWTDGTLGDGGGDLTPTEPEGTGGNSDS